MAIRNRRRCRIPAPPDNLTNSAAVREWMVAVTEEAGGAASILPIPDGRRQVLIADTGGNWVVRDLDSSHWLGTGTYSGGIYTVDPPDPRSPWTGGGGGIIGTPPESEPYPGAMYAFRPNADNTGDAYIQWDYPDTTNLSTITEQIVRPDGSTLQAGDLKNGVIALLVYDSVSPPQVPSDPGSGNHRFQLLNIQNVVDHDHVLADITDVTASAIEVNILDGATLTTVELNYVDGVTSPIQTQLNGKQPLDATLTSLAALGTAADKLAYTTGVDTWAETPLTAAARTVLDDTTTGAMLTTLGGQPLDATLTALAGLATGADKLPYSTGTDTFSQADLTAFARTLLDDANAATMLATLGAVGGNGAGVANRVALWSNSTTLTSSDGLVFAGTTLDTSSTAPRFRMFDTDTTGSSAQGYYEFYDQAVTRSGYLGFTGSAYTLSIAVQQAGPIAFLTTNTTRGTIASTGEWAIGATAPTSGVRFLITEATLGNVVQQLTSVATNDDPTLSIRQGRVTTTTNAVTTLTGGTLTLTADKAYRVNAKVVARRTGGSAGAANDVGAWEFEGVFVNTAGTAAQQGATTPIFAQGNLVTAGATATFDVNTADVRVRVTGVTNYNLTWHVTMDYSEVGT